MSDFKQSFQRGLEASERADRLRTEAEATIWDLGRQIKEATEGTVSVFFGDTWAQRALLGMARLTTGLSGKPESAEAQKAHALFAQIEAGKHKQDKTLCLIKFSPDTYPIELSWETELLICQDKTELERGLKSIMEDPRIGKKFRDLLAMHPLLVKAVEKERMLAAGKGEADSTDAPADVSTAEPKPTEPDPSVDT